MSNLLAHLYHAEVTDTYHSYHYVKSIDYMMNVTIPHITTK